jgi:hypothetical protein
MRSNLKWILKSKQARVWRVGSFRKRTMADLPKAVINIGEGEGTEQDDYEEGITEVKEGKAIIRCDKKLNIFYNAPQEINRDVRYG